MLKKISAILAVLFIVSLSHALPIRAEEYLFDAGHNNSVANAQAVPGPQVRKYIYGILGAGHDTVDYYSLTFTDYTPQVLFELLTPVRGGANPFHPSLAVLDPASGQVIGGNLPYGVPSNMGGRIYPWPKSGEAPVSDEIAFMKLIRGPQFIKDVSSARYLVAVFDPEGRGGRYVLHAGSVKSADSFFSFITKLPAIFRIKLDLY